MLEEVLNYLNNWFVAEIRTGTFAIKDGIIDLDLEYEPQYYRIIGSAYHDGLHKYSDGLAQKDEAFEGSVWILAIPDSLATMVTEIEAWSEKFAASPYSSESFGGYTYSRLTSKTGGAVTWRDVFGDRLAPYRKLAETAARAGQTRQGPSYRRPFNPDWPYGG